MRAVAISPDGALLASADADGGVTVWTVATGQLYGPVLRSGSGPAVAVAFSADGTLLAAASGDGTVQLWNPADSAPAGAPLRAGSDVSGIAFGPGGKLAIAGASGAVTVWDTAAAQPGRSVTDWIVLAAAVLALALAAGAVTITTHEVWRT